jgi:hypothetical protein
MHPENFSRLLGNVSSRRPPLALQHIIDTRNQHYILPFSEYRTPEFKNKWTNKPYEVIARYIIIIIISSSSNSSSN